MYGEYDAPRKKAEKKEKEIRVPFPAHFETSMYWLAPINPTMFKRYSLTMFVRYERQKSKSQE